MKAISSRFPIWGGTASKASWIVPIAGSNTQLQYGRFADLDMESLRPARDELGPVLTGTDTGLLRAQVRVRDAFRHIDVRCRMAAGAQLAVNLQGWWPGFMAEPSTELAAPGGYMVVSVRGLRLRAFYLEQDGAPWTKWQAMHAARPTRAEVADTIWNTMIDSMRPQPHRARAERNPWVWHFELRREQ